MHPVGSKTTTWSEPSQQASLDCPSLLPTNPSGHTIHGSFIPSRPPITLALGLGTGGYWRQERTQRNFPQIHAPQTGSVTSSARQIESGRDTNTKTEPSKKEQGATQRPSDSYQGNTLSSSPL